MKVLLINPPAENTIIGNNPTIIDEERGHNPPLGLLYIAAYARMHTKHEIIIIDSQVEEISYEQLEKMIVEEKPNVVGITAMTFTLIDVIRTAKIVKNIDKNIKVVLGGPHVHVFPEETINMPEIDFLVLGEGEIPFAELLENIDHIEKLKSIKGLVFKDDGKIINTGIKGLIDDLDATPFPARDLTPYEKYDSLMAKRTPITTMFTSRGCPYRCTFCDRPHLGKKFRARSPKNVVDEIEECTKMGIYEFLIYDDTFTLNRKRVLEICDEIIRRKLDIGWDIRTRVDTVDEEMLRRLKEANCERIHYGVEAGTEKILKILKKGITLDQVREAFMLTKKIGISTLAYFMIGSPTETREDIIKTINFAKELDPDFVHITILTPFPATELYKKGLSEGIIDKDFWREFAKDPTDDFQPEYWEENLSREELIELLNHAYKSFYVRPGYIFRELTKVRSLAEFKRKMRAGLKVLGLEEKQL